MTKNELIAEIARRGRLLTKSDAESALAAITSILHELPDVGGKLIIPEIGTFQVKQKAARMGRNPSTGEAVEIPAKKVVAFKAARAYAERVNAA